MTAPEPWNPSRAEAILAPLADLDGATLPMLHAIQAAFGCVPPQAVALIARTLNLSRAEVHGAMSFYADFRQAPAGRRVIRLCRAESCQAMGGDAAAASLMADLGVGWGETTADGAVTLEPVYCLGLCAVSPAALIDDEPVGRLDGAALVAAARA